MTSSDVGALLASLAERLPALVPADRLEVQRDRSIGDRLAGRPGTTSTLRLVGPDLTLLLQAEGRPAAQAIQEVRGVVISRRPVPVAEWLDLLAGQLRALACASAADDAAVSRTLGALGVREPGADLAVDPLDVPAGLRALPARLAGRVPDDVLAAVRRIAELLLATLPRLAADDQYAVLRTATDYLPRTLRSYVALPASFAATQRLDGGGTALESLRAQLAVLEQAATAMRDAAARADAAALLANGTFLSDRFGGSALD